MRANAVGRTAMAAKKSRRSARQQRRERQFERTREDILEAAGKAFARKGYRGTTMEEIASEAGYGVASLYTYFKSKTLIFDALVLSFVGELFATFEETPHPGSLEEKLCQLYRAQFEVAERRRETFAFFMRLAAGIEAVPDAGKKRGAKAEPNAFPLRLGAWLEQHAQMGELGKLDPVTAAFALWGTSNGLVRMWMEESPDKKLGEYTELIVDLSLRGIQGSRG